MQIASADFDRKFSDFFNMTLEMFEHQHHQIEISEKTLASIKLCCSGTASDLSDFKAKTESVLDKIEAAGSFSRVNVPENDSRSRASLRFEIERILSELKDLENLVIDGFDNIDMRKNLVPVIANPIADEIVLTEAPKVDMIKV